MMAWDRDASTRQTRERERESGKWWNAALSSSEPPSWPAGPLHRRGSCSRHILVWKYHAKARDLSRDKRSHADRPAPPLLVTDIRLAGFMLPETRLIAAPCRPAHTVGRLWWHHESRDIWLQCEWLVQKTTWQIGSVRVRLAPVDAADQPGATRTHTKLPPLIPILIIAIIKSTVYLRPCHRKWPRYISNLFRIRWIRSVSAALYQPRFHSGKCNPASCLATGEIQIRLSLKYLAIHAGETFRSHLDFGNKYQKFRHSSTTRWTPRTQSATMAT